MTHARVTAGLGAAAMLAAIAVIPFGAYAACPAGTPAASQDSGYVAVGKNGAGLPVNSAGIPIPGTALGGAADDRDKTSNRTQGVGDDRDKTSNRSQGVADDRDQTSNRAQGAAQVAQGPATAACN